MHHKKVAEGLGQTECFLIHSFTRSYNQSVWSTFLSECLEDLIVTDIPAVSSGSSQNPTLCSQCNPGGD